MQLLKLLSDLVLGIFLMFVLPMMLVYPLHLAWERWQERRR